MKKNLYFLCVLITFVSKAQPWIRGGNPPVGGLGAFPPLLNYFGGDATNPNCMHLGTMG